MDCLCTSTALQIRCIHVTAKLQILFWQFHMLYFLSFALTAAGIMIYALKRTPILSQSQQPATYRWVMSSAPYWFSDRTWTSSLQFTFAIKLYLQLVQCFYLLISVRLWPSGMWCNVVWYLSTRLHGVTSLKTVILIFSTVRTSDLLQFHVFTYAFFCHLQL